jgi:CelD/BcsL family acetyltransferase involved in cellulose biosynthesis
MVTLAVERRPWHEWNTVRAEWMELVDSSPLASFFLSAPWIETWLEVYGPDLQPEIFLFRDSQKPVAAGLLTIRRQRRGPVPLRRVFLNACGEDEHDETSLEFNDLLCLPRYERAAARALRELLELTAWDEFLVPGCSKSEASAALKQAFADTDLVSSTVPSFFINLDEMRKAGTALETSLSQKARYNIRQSMKLYQADGQLVLECAGKTQEALTQLRELAMLHQESWTARGAPGAFQSQRFVRFHELLITRTFDQGHVQTAVLRSGNKLIGALHCFGWRGKLYFYQCGFHYSTNKRLRPGLTTLLLSIQKFLELGWQEFDLMAGDTEYKRTFTSQYRDLEWLTFQRATLRTRTVAFLRTARDAYRRTASLTTTSLKDVLDVGMDTVVLLRHDLQCIPKVEAAPGLRIERVGATGLADVCSVSSVDMGELTARLARGDGVYIARLEGVPVHYSWVRFSGDHSIDEAARRVPTRPGECWIYHCITAERARGLHVYPSVLVSILRDVAAQGLRTVWIYALAHNASSLRGIERAGFLATDRLRALRVFRWRIPFGRSSERQ